MRCHFTLGQTMSGAIALRVSLEAVNHYCICSNTGGWFGVICCANCGSLHTTNYPRCIVASLTLLRRLQSLRGTPIKTLCRHVTTLLPRDAVAKRGKCYGEFCPYLRPACGLCLNGWNWYSRYFLQILLTTLATMASRSGKIPPSTGALNRDGIRHVVWKHYKTETPGYIIHRAMHISCAVKLEKLNNKNVPT